MLLLPRKVILQPTKWPRKVTLRFLTQTRWSAIYNGGRFERGPSMIRTWTGYLAPARSQVTFPALETHFALEDTIVRGPPIFLNFTKSCASPKRDTPTLRSVAPARKSDILSSPNVAPAPKKTTPTSPNVALVKKSEISVMWWDVRWDVVWNVRCEWCVMWVISDVVRCDVRCEWCVMWNEWCVSHVGMCDAWRCEWWVMSDEWCKMWVVWWDVMRGVSDVVRSEVRCERVRCEGCVMWVMWDVSADVWCGLKIWCVMWWDVMCDVRCEWCERCEMW